MHLLKWYVHLRALGDWSGLSALQRRLARTVMDDLSGLVWVIHSAALQDNVIVIIDVTSVTSIQIWILFESSIDYHNAVVHCLSVTGVTAVCLIIRSKLLWPGVGNIRGEHFVYRELFQSCSRSHCRYHAMRRECKKQQHWPHQQMDMAYAHWCTMHIHVQRDNFTWPCMRVCCVCVLVSSTNMRRAKSNNLEDVTFAFSCKQQICGVWKYEITNIHWSGFY